MERVVAPELRWYELNNGEFVCRAGADARRARQPARELVQLRVAGQRAPAVELVQRLREQLPPGPFFTSDRLDAAPTEGMNTSWWNDARLFGLHEVPAGEQPPPWHRNPLLGTEFSSATRPWWKLSAFDPELGDVKTVWEASRFDWVLAFAQRARQGDEAAIDRLNSWLRDWCEVNPAFLGPNWMCGQEASIRVLHLVLGAYLLGETGAPSSALVNLIRVHLRRIEPTMSYAIGQDNNHGTSETAALFVGGSWLASLG